MNQCNNNSNNSNNDSTKGSIFTGGTTTASVNTNCNNNSNSSIIRTNTNGTNSLISGESNGKHENQQQQQQHNSNNANAENTSISAATSDSNQNNGISMQFSNVPFTNQRQYDYDAHHHHRVLNQFANAAATGSWTDNDLPSKIEGVNLVEHQSNDRQGLDYHHHHHHGGVRQDHLLTHEQILAQEHLLGRDSLLTQEQLMNSFSPGASNQANANNRYLNDRERIQLHNQLSWEEATKQDVLLVRCRDTTAELYKSRLGSGSKGKCIKMGDTWFTPTEFETIAGRGSSKDWKRSIRFGGHTLQKLIEEGILAPHAISCTCSICCGDSTLTGPVRLFTPYKRKRREADSSRSPTINNRSRRNIESSNNNSGFNQLSALTNTLASGLVTMSHSLQSTHYTFDQIDDIMNLIATATQQLRMAWDQTKLQADAVREAAVNQIRIQAEMDKREALSHQRNEVVSILKRLLPVEHEPIVQQLLTQLHIDNMAAPKSCSNCGRDAYLECTACRRACYCSTFCQQKDWPLHQHQCANSAMEQSITDEQPDSNTAN